MTAHWPSQNIHAGTRSDARKRIMERQEAEAMEREHAEPIDRTLAEHEYRESLRALDGIPPFDG